MTDIDLIKQALEYLEDNQHHIADHERHAYVMLYNDFITALKERLAQETALQTLHNENERLGLYKDAYAGPEPEPVAWQFMNGSSFRKRRPDDFSDLASDGLPYWRPLYTTPPQRTWVGLTKEQISEFNTWHDNREEEVGWVNPSEIVAYIDAKLKQKNGYAEEKNT